MPTDTLLRLTLNFPHTPTDIDREASTAATCAFVNVVLLQLNSNDVDEMVRGIH